LFEKFFTAETVLSVIISLVLGRFGLMMTILMVRISEDELEVVPPAQCLGRTRYW
jgi:hypothetical protein